MNISDAKDIILTPEQTAVLDSFQNAAVSLAETRAFLDGQRSMLMHNFCVRWPEREECPRYRAEIERLKTLYLGPSKEPQP